MIDRYKIAEAWNLFVREGIIRAEDEIQEVVKFWQMAKIRGCNPLKSKLFLNTSTDFVPTILFDVELIEELADPKLTLFLFNENLVLHDKLGRQAENLFIELGSKISVEDIGFNALFVTAAEKRYSELNFYENYSVILHEYATIAFIIEITGHKYYLFALYYENCPSKTDIGKLNQALERFKDRREKELKIERVAFDFISYMEVDKLGQIEKLNNTYSTKNILSEGANLLHVFKNLSLKSLFLGEKQLVFSRKNPNQSFLLSPIKRNDQNGLMCTAEELSAAYRPFKEIEANNAKMPLSSISTSEPWLINILKSQCLSDLPSIIICKNHIERELIISLCSMLSREENKYMDLTLHFNEFRSIFKLSVEKVHVSQQDYAHLTYHIYNVEKLDKKNSEEVYKILEERFSKFDETIKLILYIGKKIEIDEHLARANDKIRMHVTYLSEIRGKKDMFSCLFHTESPEKDKLTSIKRDFEDGQNSLHQSEDGDVEPNQEGKSDALSIKAAEIQAIRDALVLNNYNITQAASSLGISRATLYRKIKLYRIS